VRASWIPPLAAAALCAGCKVGYAPTTGVDEPFLVEGGQFFPGPLPTGDAGPCVLPPINSLNNLAFAGQAGKQLTGDVSGGATSVLMRFADLGTGYWSVPVGSPDPQVMSWTCLGQKVSTAITWSATLDFSWSIPSGSHDMLFSTMDESGNVGPTLTNTYLVQPTLPTGKVVVSLQWDSSADLDLHLGTPEGIDLSPKQLSTSVDGGPADGIIDRDSNANCVQDGFRQEDAVFANKPTPGDYLIRVNMFSACGAPSADLVVTVRVDGAVTLTFPGRLLSTDVDNGGIGLFVGQYTVQ
jgi:hypothetical protein